MPSHNVRGRPISWRISQDKHVNALADPWAMLAYTWLIPAADNLGRMEGDPDLIASVLFPRQRDVITPSRMAEVMQMLHNAGLVFWYELDGERFLQFRKIAWAKHQHLVGGMKAESDFPEPPENLYNAWETSARTGLNEYESVHTGLNEYESVCNEGEKKGRRRGEEGIKYTGAKSNANSPASEVPEVTSAQQKSPRTGENKREPHPDTAALVDSLYYPLKERGALPTSKGWYVRQQITAQTMLGVRPLGDWQACIAWGLSHHYHADKCLSLAYVDRHVWPQYAQRDIAGGARAAPNLRETVNAYAAWAERQENGGAGDDSS